MRGRGGVCIVEGHDIGWRHDTSKELTMTASWLLHKRAVVFGAGGSIGAAVATELAREGAEVFLAGRTASSVKAVENHIIDAGGRAHADVIDALDVAAVDGYL